MKKFLILVLGSFIFLPCFQLLAVDGDDQHQVMISARFFEEDKNGVDVLSAPRIATFSGQQASISIGQEIDGEKVFDGIYLSVKATVQETGISFEGIAFLGKQEIGEEGIAGKAKKAWEFFEKKEEPESIQAKLGKPSFSDEVEMRGMFQIKGKPPMVSLHLKNGGSFWLELGQRRNGIKLAWVDSVGAYAILEKDGRFARIEMKKQKTSVVDLSVPLEGEGHAFFRQKIQSGKSFTMDLGEGRKVELMVEKVDPGEFEN
ncbi:MAG: hypothetical protein CMI30_06035 [Opitutae bacterium]|nr:hypothetical protein [Opitutae bacterium]